MQNVSYVIQISLYRYKASSITRCSQLPDDDSKQTWTMRCWPGQFSCLVLLAKQVKTILGTLLQLRQ
jgi:hypothetical protein